MVILVTIWLSSCDVPNADKKSEAVYYCVKDVMDFTTRSVESFLYEVEKSRLADSEEEQDEDSGYPEGYDPYNPIANGEFTEEDWAAIQYEEALNSLYNDIMHEQFDYKPDISDRVIKP